MEAEGQRKIPLLQSTLPFAVAIVSLFAALFFLHTPIYLALLVGWITAIIIGRRHGYQTNTMLLASFNGMKGTFVVVTILLLIGGVIAVWMASGTVAGLIVYGVELVRPQFLVGTAFLLTVGMSMLLGTSVGTLSTMGIALAGIGQVYGVPASLMGGALISGAMVGDRTSPLSGALHLLAATTETKVDDIFPRIIRSALPIFFICLFLYGWLGLTAVDAHLSIQTGLHEVERLRQGFVLHWMVLLPPLLVLLLALFRIPIRYNLLLGIAMGSLLAFRLQEVSASDIAAIIWNGFAMRAADGSVLLQGGGIWKMLSVVLIILVAGALNGILEATGMTRSLIGGLLERIRQEKGLTAATVIISLIAGLIFCNQALMVIIPGRMLQPKYAELGVERLQLAKTLADSGVVVSALIPWNLHAILCSAAMGIATSTYWPYAFFLWGFPMLTLVRALLKKSSQKNV